MKHVIYIGLGLVMSLLICHASASSQTIRQGRAASPIERLVADGVIIKAVFCQIYPAWCAELEPEFRCVQREIGAAQGYALTQIEKRFEYCTIWRHLPSGE